MAPILAFWTRYAPQRLGAEVSSMSFENSRDLALENLEQAAASRLNYSFELQRRDFCKLLGADW